MDKFQTKVGNKFRCDLCLNHCLLEPGQRGECIAREATEDGIYLDGYGRISTMAVEPIEKKPIFHFAPNRKVLSIGAYGCNLRCKFCQNSKIAWNDIKKECKYFSASAIANFALNKRCLGVCFTYNEPIIYYEFLYDLADKCHKNGLFFVISTNAFVNGDVWDGVCEMTDVMNIDWKIRYKTPRDIGSNYDYQVLSNIKTAILRKDVHVEISIPVYHDLTIAEADAIKYFFSGINIETPIHLLKIFPTDTYCCPSTPDSKLFDLRDELMTELPYVYVANVFSEEGVKARETICPDCKGVVMMRESLKTRFVFNIKCDKCKSIIFDNEQAKEKYIPRKKEK